MVEEDSVDRPFNTIAETVNEETAQALELLSNETRLEFIVALWDAIDPTPSIAGKDESGLSFSALYDRVGVEDSGQFNYHLDKLTGTFVDYDHGTYMLTRSAMQILSAVIAGAVTDPPSFTDEPVDTDCPLCGGSVVIDYTDGTLRMRCTNCEGNFRGADDPSGLLMTTTRDPVGLTNRSPQEFFSQGNVSQRHTVLSYIEGVCPNCTGTVTATPIICENHEAEDGSLCPHCNKRAKIWWTCVCDACKSSYVPSGWAPIFAETAVMSFCYQRGLDIRTVFDMHSWGDVYDAVDTNVSARDPLEITVTVELEGDRLTVTLDDDANVVDIVETTGVA